MLDKLLVVNLPTGTSMAPVDGRTFVLNTCQRTLMVSLKDEYQAGPLAHLHRGTNAYRFLLETICGLKSRVLGESEITAQFKEAYSRYLDGPERDTRLMRIMEKLFKDAKEVRSRHLHKVGQQSYAGITRQLLSGYRQAQDVLILGSGALCRDLIKLLKKRHQVVLSARNGDKVNELVCEFGVSSLPWMDVEAWSQRAHIVNTIGAEQTVLTHDFFQEWERICSRSRLFVDLGSPSVISTPYGKEEGVLRLEDIFQKGALLDQEKQQKVTQAHHTIEGLVLKRLQTFSDTLPVFGEEYQFA